MINVHAIIYWWHLNILFSYMNGESGWRMVCRFQCGEGLEEYFLFPLHSGVIKYCNVAAVQVFNVSKTKRQ